MIWIQVINLEDVQEFGLDSIFLLMDVTFTRALVSNVVDNGRQLFRTQAASS